MGLAARINVSCTFYNSPVGDIENREILTCIEGVSAGGQVLHPVIIYQGIGHARSRVAKVNPGRKQKKQWLGGVSLQLFKKGLERAYTCHEVVDCTWFSALLACIWLKFSIWATIGIAIDGSLILVDIRMPEINSWSCNRHALVALATGVLTRPNLGVAPYCFIVKCFLTRVPCVFREFLRSVVLSFTS